MINFVKSGWYARNEHGVWTLVEDVSKYSRYDETHDRVRYYRTQFEYRLWWSGLYAFEGGRKCQS